MKAYLYASFAIAFFLGGICSVFPISTNGKPSNGIFSKNACDSLDTNLGNVLLSVICWNNATSFDEMAKTNIPEFLSPVEQELAYLSGKYTAVDKSISLKDREIFHAMTAILLDELGFISGSQNHLHQACNSLPSETVCPYNPRIHALVPTVVTDDYGYISSIVEWSNNGNFESLAWNMGFDDHYTITPPWMMLGYFSPSDYAVHKQLSAKLNSLYPPFTSTKIQVNKKPRIAYISSWWIEDHSVFRLFSNLVSQHDEFDVYLIISSHFFAHDMSSQFMTKLCSKPIKCIKTGKNFSSTIKLLSGIELDIIVYLEIGMDTFVYHLARQRLAGVQICLWGHPISQQLPSIDFFVSSELYEGRMTDDGVMMMMMRPVGVDYDRLKLHSEQVVMMDSIAMTMSPSSLVSSQYDDDILSIIFHHLRHHHHQSNRSSPIPHLYTFPHTLMKFHANHSDIIIRSIINSDSDAIIVIPFTSRQAAWKAVLQDRLCGFDHIDDVEMKMGESVCIFPPYNDSQMMMSLTNYSINISTPAIIFIHRLPKPSFYHLIQSSSVVIDTSPFGMGVTAIETLMQGTPIVTNPNTQLVPMLVSGFYKAFEVSDDVVSAVVAMTVSEVTKKAIDLASNATLQYNVRQQLESQVNEAKMNKLVHESQVEWKRFINRITKMISRPNNE